MTSTKTINQFNIFDKNILECNKYEDDDDDNMSLNNLSIDSTYIHGCDTHCGICHDKYLEPAVLPCLHTFCQKCIKRKINKKTNSLFCVHCGDDITLRNIDNFLPNLIIKNNNFVGNNKKRMKILEQFNLSSTIQKTVSYCCKTASKDLAYICYCEVCDQNLCRSCSDAHKTMSVFSEHHLTEVCSENESVHDKCADHPKETVSAICLQCYIGICATCQTSSHLNHKSEIISPNSQIDSQIIFELGEKSKLKAHQLQDLLLSDIKPKMNMLLAEHKKLVNDIQHSHEFFLSILKERFDDLLNELEMEKHQKEIDLKCIISKSEEISQKLLEGSEFIDSLFNGCKYVYEISLYKNLAESRLQGLMEDINVSTNLIEGCNMEYTCNLQTIQTVVQNSCGYLQKKKTPFCNFTPRINSTLIKQNNNTTSNSSIKQMKSKDFSKDYLTAKFDSIYRQNSTPLPNNFLTPDSAISIPSPPNSDKSNSGKMLMNNDQLLAEYTAQMINANTYPQRSQVKRGKMAYVLKIGEFGVLPGQFTEPSGITVNALNDIIIADTNNHRIQIFDSAGLFKFQFGECGKRDGQMLYPNRVAVVKDTGDIVVTERSPTHQVQIFNQWGKFVRKFGSAILQHPRGVTVDLKRQIIIVECKVMRVIIFDLLGNIVRKFNCSSHLEFPNGLVVNEKEEIFISDNRAHSVKVFNYYGQYLRQIGGEGITNYPIGVGINSNGEILIADNHNNFNLTVFKDDGKLLHGMESKVKHAQCFDVALMYNSDSVILASKDYRIYVYKYMESN